MADRSPPSYVYLGASEYSLKVLREIIQKFGHVPSYIVDSHLENAVDKQRVSDALGGAVPPRQICDSAVLKDEGFLRSFGERPLDLALSVHFSEILSDQFIATPRFGVANLHSGYLPFNRGHWPEVWSIVRGTPAGVTLHFIDSGVDTGPIIDQVREPVRPEDTCASLARRLEVLGLDLVLRNWPALVAGRALSASQGERFPLNLHKHLSLISEIDLDRSYTGRELLDVLRALTIPHLLRGASFVDPETGDKIHVRVEMSRHPPDATLEVTE
jgi:methionyl-tRNA formyltransferase